MDVDVLRDSFKLVVDREPHVVGHFYEDLFGRHPEARALFVRNDSDVQERMLAEALSAVVDHLEDVPWLSETLGALGARHVGYEVTPEMYDWVGASLLATLAKVAGPQWTPELEGAWTEAYGAIASLMQSGARAAAEPA